MEVLNYSDIRAQLVDRRGRVESTVKESPADHLVNLLKEIDLALERIDTGTYGFCEICGDPIEQEILQADPLVKVCIDDLSKHQQKMLENDLTLASQIQQTLLPKKNVSKIGWEINYHYQPAGAVSGDYCDVIETSDGKKELFFVIADVSGKGVSASLLMTHIHAMFHSLIGFGLPVNDIVERANRLLCESTLSSHYATLAGGKIDEEGNLEICVAGHCPPILLSGNEKIEISATGVPIGLFCSSEYTVRRYKLSPKDTLLIYTDGLSEAHKDSEEYGSERIADSFQGVSNLPLPEIINHLISDMKKFVSGTPQSDDLTIMMIRRTQ